MPGLDLFSMLGVDHSVRPILNKLLLVSIIE